MYTIQSKDESFGKFKELKSSVVSMKGVCLGNTIKIPFLRKKRDELLNLLSWFIVIFVGLWPLLLEGS
jgi:hypothetical protein